MKNNPIKSKQSQNLKTAFIDTVLGPMIAISDEKALYYLAFTDQKGVKRSIERLTQKTKSSIIPQKTPIIQSIEKELSQYFKGKLKVFNTPLSLLGSPFQLSVWKALQKIPHGKTCSYADIATAIDKSTAFRAVANANGANPIAIVIPCHRVIHSDGGLGGYGGGISRKEWLIEHENNMKE